MKSQRERERSPVRPDLAKFRHFGKKFKVFGHFWYGLISVWQTFLPNLAIFMLLG